MNFSVNCSEVLRREYEELFTLVIEFYLGLFEDTKLYQSKILFTEVRLNLVKGSSQSSASIRCLNSGYEVLMDINPIDSKDYILHQFAHEMAHLILMPLRYNYCLSSAYNSTDQSYAITTLTRKSGSVTYGILFEEAFCNWLALKAVSYVLEKDYSNASYISKNDISLIDSVVNAFEMSNHTKWDSISKDGNPANFFLFGIACGDISYAINCVDTIMGRGSWRELMKNSYLYLTDTNKQKEAGWRIKLLLREFKKEFKKGEEKRYA